MNKVTEVAAWRATRARPINDTCRWVDAFESVSTTNIRLLFAWQRMLLRAWWGA